MPLRWSKKLLITFKIMWKGDGYERAEYLKSLKIFKEFGEKNYWYTRNLPSEPECVCLHDNIKIATGVYFCTHDIFHMVLNDDQELLKRLEDKGGEKYVRHVGDIEIFDNVFIGANSTIMYNVKIGPNAIVAANSVVVKDVPEGIVVGGNPARVIGLFDDVVKKRIEESLL